MPDSYLFSQLPHPPPLLHSAHFIYEYVEAYPSVAAKGHPLWNFWPNLPTSLALVVSLGVTLISQARLAPDVKDAPLNHIAAHVGVGGVMFLVVLGTLYLTVSATGWVYRGVGCPKPLHAGSRSLFFSRIGNFWPPCALLLCRGPSPRQVK